MLIYAYIWLYIYIYNYVSIHIKLVGGLEPWNFMTFNIGNFIIPTDELIFFRGVGIPPTRTVMSN